MQAGGGLDLAKTTTITTGVLHLDEYRGIHYTKLCNFTPSDYLSTSKTVRLSIVEFTMKIRSQM